MVWASQVRESGPEKAHRTLRRLHAKATMVQGQQLFSLALRSPEARASWEGRRGLGVEALIDHQLPVPGVRRGPHTG